MPIAQYYYNRLPPRQQAVYEQVFAGFTSHQTEIKIDGRCANDEIWKIAEYVTLDHPQLFYIGRKSNIVTRGNKISLHPDYLFSRSAANRVQCQIDAKVETLFGSSISKNEDMAFLERAIYTQLAINTKYRHKCRESEHTNFSIIGPLLDGFAVCEGYAKTFKYLCDCFDLPCLVVTGTAYELNGDRQQPHAWNIVKLNGNSYHADVTWDSCVDDSSYLFYFNLSDAEIAKDHRWDRTLLPSCNIEFSNVTCVTSRKMFEKFVIGQVANKRMSFQIQFNKQFDNEDEIIDMVLIFLDSAPPDIRNMVSSVGVRYIKALCKAVIRLQ